MMNDVSISVIMPVYNAKDYVGRAIESVLNQDFDSFELILVDDGSTDGSGAICDEYAKNDCRIVLIHQTNAGTCAARNVGLSIAKGKYITFCDHDDEYLPHLLRDNFELIEKEKADVLQFSINRIFTEQNNFVLEQRLKNGVFFADEKNEWYLNVRLNENFIDVWNRFYKKDLVADLNFNTIFNHGLEDACFNLMVVPKIQKYVTNSGVYYNHYLYANSSGVVEKQQASADSVNQMEILFDAEYYCLKEIQGAQKCSKDQAGAILNFYMSCLMHRFVLSSKKDFELFRKTKLLCAFPLKLRKEDQLYLWSFNNCYWLFRTLTKFGFDCGANAFQQSALYGFFGNLHQSKRGRWLFDLCNFFIKMLTLPCRLVK